MMMMTREDLEEEGEDPSAEQESSRFACGYTATAKLDAKLANCSPLPCVHCRAVLLLASVRHYAVAQPALTPARRAPIRRSCSTPSSGR